MGWMPKLWVPSCRATSRALRKPYAGQGQGWPAGCATWRAHLRVRPPQQSDAGTCRRHPPGRDSTRGSAVSKCAAFRRQPLGTSSGALPQTLQHAAQSAQPSVGSAESGLEQLPALCSCAVHCPERGRVGDSLSCTHLQQAAAVGEHAVGRAVLDGQACVLHRTPARGPTTRWGWGWGGGRSHRGASSIKGHTGMWLPVSQRPNLPWRASGAAPAADCAHGVAGALPAAGCRQGRSGRSGSPNACGRYRLALRLERGDEQR